MSSTMKIVCTDQGNHGQIELGKIEVSDDGRLAAIGHRLGRPIGSSAKSIMPTAVIHDADRHKWRMQCPRCGRDVQRTEAKMETMAGQLQTARRDLLDISTVPTA
jgi:hypothetical protein